MQLSDLKSNPHDGKIHRDLIDHTVGVPFYPLTGSEYYKLLHLNRFHGSTHINDKHNKNNEKKIG